MVIFYVIFQIVSAFALGITIGKGIIWFKQTKTGQMLIAIILLPYILWIFHKLVKSEILAKLQDKIEREKITFYFETS